MSDWLADDFPHTPVVSVCFVRDQPAGLDQKFGRVDCAFPISEGLGSVDVNVPSADGGFGPFLEEGEQ